MPNPLLRKKTPPMVGAPVKNKVKKKTTKPPVKTKVKTKVKKNKNIVDTKAKNIPTRLKAKVKQKLKNIGNNTPKQNLKKVKKAVYEYMPMGGKNKRYAKKSFSNLKKKVSSVKNKIMKKIKK